MNEIDELKIFRGEDYYITDKFYIKQLTLDEICDIGEKKYLSMVSTLLMTPQTMIYELSNMGIDFEAISDFELFALFCSQFDYERTKILIPNINFATSRVEQRNRLSVSGKVLDSKEFVIVTDNGVVINKKIYQEMTDFLRKTHHIEKLWWKTIGNASTKKRIIRDAENEYLQAKNFPKPYKSQYLPLISSMVNCSDFKYDHKTVWDLTLYQFFDAVKRIQNHECSTHLYTGVYSGCVEFNKVKNDLNWMM